ncbi:MAG: hypothetical protein HKN67_03025 [Saprospiraceae bacterium]|nr:hypothetical protein [Saprospiraceae bacterium]
MIYLRTIINKVILLLFLGWTSIASAQPQDNSPYSRFGIGDILGSEFNASLHMGGLGASFIDPYTINIVNPASLSYLRTASFDMGIHAEYSTLSDRENSSISDWNGSLDYLSLAFPLQNVLNDILDRKQRDINLGMAFSLMPYSNVGYNVSSYLYNEDFGNYELNYQGNGGSYQFLWSNGIRYKDFAFGLNLGYLFGKITNSTIIDFPDINNAFASFLDRSTNLSGLTWNAGVLYTLHLNKGAGQDESSDNHQKLIFGLYGKSSTTLNYESNIFETSSLRLLDGGLIRDTLTDIRGEKVSGKMPSELGLGISYVKGSKFSLGFNYEQRDWTKFEGDFVKNNLKDTYSLSFGGFYRPNYKSISNYFSRVFYRFGGFYRKVPVEIASGEDIKDYGISFGLGMPFFYQRKISHANLGLILGWRGMNTAIEEKYIRLSFSFTFNDDEWFIKRKYN